MASASSLLLDEMYEAGDERFVGEVLASTAGKKLKALAPRWYQDQRPFARRALLEAASWRGLDNLFIPLGLYFLLANLLYLGVVGLAVICACNSMEENSRNRRKIQMPGLKFI